ncbi:MAG: phosphate ABC transporter substrate-binding protein [Gammaproteobacteria bacterium]|nr:phosphate ABC transporter substrate-binding protein [Gammaproteobacteria bacterium]
MKKCLKRVSLITVGILCLLSVNTTAWAGMAIIAHPDNSQHGVNVQTIADMYMDKLQRFSNGSKVEPVDQAKGSDIREKFYRSVLKMTEREANRYWAKRKFTGKAQAPKELTGDRAIKEWVAATPGGLGYIDGKSLDKSVKVLLIIP